ncbi:MAG TPA: AraC family transcriptional regulator ligand-binding domain-containing protein [Steroidobacteraceae bacterium]|nr:AraC family transcriptional regulator ligand-binding domain-containing protein [Steroidobacteraceae bacterium]
MAVGQERLPSRYFATLLDYLESTGVTRGEVLRAARIRSFDPRGQLTVAQTEAVLEAAERLTGRQDLGFELGRRVKATSHDILGYALLTSATLAEVFRLLSNYQRLIQPFFALRVQRRAGRVELLYVPVAALTPRGMRNLEEAIAVSDHFEFRSLLKGRLPAYDLYLSIERPPHAARYHELNPARVHFGDPAPGLRLSLDERLLEVPLELADPNATRAAEERCKAMLAGARGDRRWSDWCRMMIREAEDCRPTLAQLAGFMNLSPRTLHRYLEAENQSFRALALEERTIRARRLLETGLLPVTQIAYRLGYSDVASFVRAFGRETGLTPTQCRRAAARDRPVERDQL